MGGSGGSGPSGDLGLGSSVGSGRIGQLGEWGLEHRHVWEEYPLGRGSGAVRIQAWAREKVGTMDDFTAEVGQESI